MNAINIFQWTQREHPAAGSEQRPWCTWIVLMDADENIIVIKAF